MSIRQDKKSGHWQPESAKSSPSESQFSTSAAILVKPGDNRATDPRSVRFASGRGRLQGEGPPGHSDDEAESEYEKQLRQFDEIEAKVDSQIRYASRWKAMKKESAAFKRKWEPKRRSSTTETQSTVVSDVDSESDRETVLGGSTGKYATAAEKSDGDSDSSSDRETDEGGDEEEGRLRERGDDGEGS